MKIIKRFLKKSLIITIIISLSQIKIFAQKNFKEITFFCGAAVAVPMREIIKNYEQETGNKVNVIYGGSGTLLSQMELTKRGDVYLCGSPDYIDIGVKKGLLIKGSDKIVSYLIPALVVPIKNPKNIEKLEDLRKDNIIIGMGNPETVCLGLYGVELLEYNNLLEIVIPKVKVFAKSCEDTATLAVLQKVDVIIGWDVFESWNPQDVKWIKLKPEEIPRISYIPISIPVFVKNKKLANDFINYILSPEKGRKIFEKYGYISDIKEAKKFAPKAKIGGVYELPKKYFELIEKR